MKAYSQKRAKDNEEIKPLIDFCKAGRLFDVQDWIAAGKPVNPSPPPPPEKGARKKFPLQFAINSGFHSLVEVLLEGGALVQDDSYNALEQALRKRRLDLIRLLVKHGADVQSVEMYLVFETWDPAIMEYFIEQGADVETDYPLAGALCERIRTAIGVFLRHKDRFPSFQKQINFALRHHCMEGNLKWVSLLLWAGADPFDKGPVSFCEDPDPDEDLCALEYAGLYHHLEIFKMKNINIPPGHPIIANLLQYACWADKADFLIELLEKGYDLASQSDLGSSLIQKCICCMRLTIRLDYLTDKRLSKNIDSPYSLERLKMVHILAKHGAKWMPEDHHQINDARRSLLKLKADYTVELIWIMSKYEGCSRNTIEQLLRTSTIRRHIAEYKERIEELLKKFS